MWSVGLRGSVQVTSVVEVGRFRLVIWIVLGFPAVLGVYSLQVARGLSGSSQPSGIDCVWRFRLVDWGVWVCGICFPPVFGFGVSPFGAL